MINLEVLRMALTSFSEADDDLVVASHLAGVDPDALSQFSSLSTCGTAENLGIDTVDAAGLFGAGILVGLSAGRNRDAL